MANSAAGDVDARTRFDYHQDGDLIWARYQGGAIRLGFLVGRREGDRLDFRYSHLDAGGRTSNGHCVSRIETLADGRLRLRERWQWESRAGEGVGVVEQVEVKAPA
jgi:hypothetical protein